MWTPGRAGSPAKASSAGATSGGVGLVVALTNAMRPRGVSRKRGARARARSSPAPAWTMPAASSRRPVVRKPAGPRSIAWLFARPTIVNPSARRSSIACGSPAIAQSSCVLHTHASGSSRSAIAISRLPKVASAPRRSPRSRPARRRSRRAGRAAACGSRRRSARDASVPVGRPSDESLGHRRIRQGTAPSHAPNGIGTRPAPASTVPRWSR